METDWRAALRLLKAVQAAEGKALAPTGARVQEGQGAEPRPGGAEGQRVRALQGGCSRQEALQWRGHSPAQRTWRSGTRPCISCSDSFRLRGSPAGMIRAADWQPGCPIPGSAIGSLRDLGQVMAPLCASVSPLKNGDNQTLSSPPR